MPGFRIGMDWNILKTKLFANSNVAVITMVISLPEFLSNTNQKWTIIVAF